MAHTLDTSLGVALSTANPRTANYTCGAGTTVLIVAITVVGGTARTGGAPTFNSIALTPCSGSPQKYTSSPETTTELWYLLNPPTGTQYSLSIPNTNTVNLYTRIASFKAGTNLKSSLDGGTGSNGVTLNPSFNLTPSKAGGVLFAIVGSGNTAIPTGYTHTSLLPVDHGQYSSAAQYTFPASTSQVTMTFTISADDWGMVWVHFNEVSPIASTISSTSTDSATLTRKNVPIASTIVTVTTHSASLTDIPGKISATVNSGRRSKYTSVCGFFYNWLAASSPLLPPAGWHLPSMAEFTQLYVDLGGYAVAGGYLKETGTAYWTTQSAGTDNRTGFTGRGAGYRSNWGTHTSYRNTVSYFCSTLRTDGGYQGLHLSATLDAISVWQDTSGPYPGYTVRLIKDDSFNPGTMLDNDGNVYNTVKIGQQVWMASDLIQEHFNNNTKLPYVPLSNEWAALTVPGYCYPSDNVDIARTSNGYTESVRGTLRNKNKLYSGSSTLSAISASLTNQSTAYLLSSIINTASSGTATIRSKAPAASTITNTTTGTATLIQSSKIRATITSGYIYATGNIVRYGTLYNWNAINHASKISSSDDWIVPTETHYNTLSAYLSGWTYAGGHVKEIGTINWQSPNTAADNSSKFNSRANGYISATGISGNIRYASYFALNTLWDANNIKNAANSSTSNDNLTVYNLFNCGVGVRLLNPNTLLSHGQKGTYTGNDGQVYPTICIGTQEWVSCNLIETKLRDNTSIPLITNQTAWNDQGWENGTEFCRCYYSFTQSNAYNYGTIWLSTLTPYNFGFTTAEKSTASTVAGTLTEAQILLSASINTATSGAAALTEKLGLISASVNTTSSVVSALSIKKTNIASTINTATSLSANLLIKYTYIESTINPFTSVSSSLTEKPGKILSSVNTFSSTSGSLQIQTAGILSTINPFTSTASTLTDKPGKLNTSVFTFSTVSAGMISKVQIASTINPYTSILALLYDQPFLPTITFI